jgi:uncharacterized membrane protein
VNANLVGYLATLVSLTVIDIVWLSRMADVFYRPAMGDAVLQAPRIAPAIVFYLLFAVGLTYFAVSPAVVRGAWWTAALNGALLGFFAYATYDLTNQATLRNWSTLLSMVDMGWGAILSAIAATAGYLAVLLLDRSQ